MKQYDDLCQKIRVSTNTNSVIWYWLFSTLFLLVLTQPASAAPSLLLDKRVNNTNPDPGQTFRYIIRYRCASLTEDCTGAQIVDSVPSDLEIKSYSPASGNIASATDDGNNTITWTFTDPLPAGSTGALNINVSFPGCGAAQPNPVTNTATFSSSNASSITANAPTVTMNGLLDSCPVTPPTVPSFSKSGSAYIANGGFSTYQLNLDNTTAHVVTDYFPPQTIVTELGELWGDDFEIQCGSNATWHSYDYASKDDLDGSDDVSDLPGCESVPIPNSSVGHYFNITAVRFNVSATSNRYFRVRFGVLGTNPFTGGELPDWQASSSEEQVQNCISRDDTGDTACTVIRKKDEFIQPFLRKELIGDQANNFYENGARFSYHPVIVEDDTANPPVVQGETDLVYRLSFAPLSEGGISWDSPVIVDLLPPELSFDPSVNWWKIALSPDQNRLDPLVSPINNPACFAPEFNVIEDYQGTGRTALIWEFTGCSLPVYEAGRIPLAIVFSTTIVPSTAATTVIDNGMAVLIPEEHTPPSTCSFSNSGNYWLDQEYDTTDYDEDGDVTEKLCTAVQSLYTVPTLAEMKSSKYVQGKLDSVFDRYPTYGDTDQTGEGAYEMFIENGGNVNVTQFDVVDFLPFVGDTGVLSANGTRDSDWEMQLANDIIIERYNSVTGVYDPVPVSDLLDNEVKYSSSNNPCRFNGVEAFDNLSITGNEPASCAALASGSATGAKSFGFRFTPATAFAPGEKLKITVNVAISGGIPANSGDIAWNSFGYSGLYEDGGSQPLINSEPIKVGLRMIDTANRAALGNYIWFDANNNGIQEGTEAGIANVIVNLYASDGTTLLDTTNTDGSGYYRFDNLDPSTPYVIKLDNPSNFSTGALAGLQLTQQNQGTDAEDNDASLNVDNYPEISATTNAADGNPTTGAAGSFTDTYDFGFWNPAALGNYVWYDVDGFGDQTAGEQPVENLTVNLYDSDGAFVDTTTTDATGYYLFDPLPADSYYLVFDKSSITGTDPVTAAPVDPADWDFTALNATGNPTNDSDANSAGRTVTTVLEPGERDMSWDAGLQPYTPPVDPVSVGDFVWEDVNADGIQNVGELGIENVRVDLIEGGFPVKTTYTDSTGFYQFDDIERNAQIQIRFTPPTGTALTLQDQGGDDTADSDVDPVTGETIQFTLDPTVGTTGSATLDPRWDAGIINTTLSLGNLVWEDTNQDGLYSVGEPLLSGLTVNLLGTSTATTTTDSNGRYLFTGLAAGSYQVEVEIPAGYSVTATTANSANPDSGTDNDHNGVDTTSNAGFARSNAITLELGGGDWSETDHGVDINSTTDTTLDRNADYTVDFGFVEGVPPCSITATATVSACTNVGSDADSSNDTYTVTLNVSGTNTSANFDYSSTAASVGESGIAFTASPYATPAITIEATDSPQTLTVVDSVDASCSATVTPVVTEPATCSNPATTDIALVKAVSANDVVSGDTIIYTLTANNTSGNDASGIVITDVLPAGITYASDDGGVNTTEAGGTVTWNLGNLATGGSAVLNITVTVD